MKVSELFTKIFSADQTVLVQGIEKELQLHRRGKNILYFIAAAFAPLLAWGIDNGSVRLEYFQYFLDFVDAFIRNPRNAFASYRPIYSLVVLSLYFIFLVIYATVLLGRFRRIESEEPFRYTFWINPFAPVDGTPDTRYTLTSADRLKLLHHDLMEKLSDRIKRLSLLNLDGLSVDAGPDVHTRYDPIREIRSKMIAHIHISGNYAIREEQDDHWVIHVMPQVRIGSALNPARLAHAIKFSLESDRALRADQYNQFFERVYSSVATEVYRQIEADVDEKKKLFPTARMRAVAFFNEAEDFAASNTVDAYDRAIRLYREALRHFELFQIKPITRFVIDSPVPFVWRIRVRLVHQLTRIKTGYIKCLTYRRFISAFTGRNSNPIFEARPIIDETLEVLEKIHNKMIDKGHVPAFLVFPRDSWIRHRLRFFVTTESLYKKHCEILFDSYVTAALAYFQLGALEQAPKYLEKARAVNPRLCETNALFVLTSGLIEADLNKSILFLRQATELHPTFQIAQYTLAKRIDHLFRLRNDISPARAASVIDEYERVVTINPGNIAALSAQGYLWWLVGDLRSAAKKFVEGSQFKNVVSDTFVGELTYGLARVAAEEDRFNDAYDLYQQAISADPGIATYLGATTKQLNTLYYDYIVPNIFARYSQFKTKVQTYSDLKLNLVRKFAVNDFEFSTADVKNPFLLDKIKDSAKTGGKDSIYSYLKKRIMEDGVSGNGQDPIVDHLNRVLKTPNLYSDSRFTGIAIPDKLLRLIKQHPVGHELVRLNRLLLEIVFQDDLVQTEHISERTINTVYSYVVNDYGNACLGYYARFGKDSSLDNAIDAFKEAVEVTRNENVIACFNRQLAWIWKGADNLNDFERVIDKYQDQQTLIFSLAKPILTEPEWIRAKRRQLDALRNSNQLKRSVGQNGFTQTTNVPKSLASSADANIDILKEDLTKWRKLQRKITEIMVRNSNLYFLLAKEEDNNLPATAENTWVRFDEKMLERINEITARKNLTAERLKESDFFALQALIKYFVVTSGEGDNASKFTLKDLKLLCDKVASVFAPEDFDMDSIYEEIYSRSNEEDFKEEFREIYFARRRKVVDTWLEQDPLHYFGLTWVNKEYFADYTARKIKYWDRSYEEALRLGTETELSYCNYLARWSQPLDLEKSKQYYERNIQYQKAEEYHKRVIALSREKDIQGYLNLALFYEKTGTPMLSEAVRYLSEALAIDEANATCHAKIISISLEMEEHQRAEELFKAAIGSKPGDAEFLYDFGDRLYENQRWEMSSRAFELTTQIKPDSDDYWNKLGNALYFLGNYEGAKEKYRRAISLDTKNANYHSNLGHAHYAMKQWQEALTAFRVVTVLDPLAANRWNDLGNAHYNLKDYSNATDCYSKALESDSGNEVYYANVILALDQNGDTIKAHEFFETAIKVNPNDADYFYRLGDGLYQNRQWDKAMRSFLRATELKLNTALCWNSLGNAYYGMGSFEKALECYKKAVALEPDIGVYYSNLGLTFRETGNLDEAINLITRASQLEPDNATRHNDLGNTYYRRPEYSKAVECYKTAIALEPNAAVYHSNLGLAYKELKEWKEAIKAFTEASTLEPSNPEVWNELGISYYGLTDYHQAVWNYEETVKLDPMVATYHSNLGLAYSMLRDFDKSAKAYADAAILEPNNATRWVELGSTYSLMARYTDAVRCYEKAIEIDSKTGDFFSFLGLALKELQQYGEAIDAFTKATKLDPTDLLNWNQLGNIHATILGEYGKAIGFYKEAIRLAPQSAVYYHNIALSYIRLKRWKEGVNAYTTASMLEPLSAVRWNELANAYVAAGDILKAANYFRKAIELEPEAAVYRSNLGIILNRLGENDNAIEALTQSLEIRSDASTHSELGMVYAAQKLYERAADQHLKAFELNPVDIYADRLVVVCNSIDSAVSLPYIEAALKIDAVNSALLAFKERATGISH